MVLSPEPAKLLMIGIVVVIQYERRLLVRSKGTLVVCPVNR